VFEGSFGRGHPNTAKARENLAALRRLMGEPGEEPRTKRLLVWRSRGEPKARPAPGPAAKPARATTFLRAPKTPAAKPTALKAPPPARRAATAATPQTPEGQQPAGRYAVLVSSMRDAAAVPEEWRMLRRQFPALARLDLRPPHAETTANGTVYRLVAGAFSAEAQAEAVCEGLRAGGQHCRVVTR
jgi:hypothetical protein